MSLLLTHSVRVLPHSIRQLLSEQAKVQSMYASSHWSTHFAPVSSSLKTNRPKPDYIGSMTNKKNSRAGFWANQIQEIRAARCNKKNRYFISHNNDEIIDPHSNIKEN